MRELSSRNILQLPKSSHLLTEIGSRLALAVLLVITEHLNPRIRDIHPEEWWLYKNHPSDSYVPAWLMWLFILLIIPVSLLCLTAFCPATMDQQASTNSSSRSSALLTCQLAYWLIILLAGNLANTIKVIVGRPRPDFYYRCYPDDHEHEAGAGAPMQSSLQMQPCYGDLDSIIEGRKSFPSGHSTFSFASLGFLSLLLWRRFGLWRRFPGAPSAWQLLLGGLPLFIAMCIALSRLADFHHHCEDVAVGSILGFSVAYICFKLYYPELKNNQLDCVSSVIDRSPSSVTFLAQQQQQQQQLQQSASASGMKRSASTHASADLMTSGGSSSSQGGLFEVRSM
ncbi:hypothetical protein BOX15_Mlig027232g1 [Macrostomum lignano]|uniref:Phosphatidic acid phosphatase type 2/haloperoxidase domain-containing protein n=1 Tax=Macrostomum lignano TaxID=282301 RepID=A0A267E421_9PLAT|nr:hypothetical protein BOX15_Mlig027232g1 [Macrostomum lignano]